jgi:hypothetical protein
VVSPVPAQERLRGWLHGRLPLESSSIRRLEGVADGRLEDVQWRGWRCLVVSGSHSDGDGVAVLGMVAQRWGWPQRANGDEEMRSNGPTSRRRPVRTRGRRPYPFRGFRRPLSRGAACRLYGSGWHNVTELTPTFPHSSPTVPGMASREGLAEQRRDMIPRRCQRGGMARIHF